FWHDSISAKLLECACLFWRFRSLKLPRTRNQILSQGKSGRKDSRTLPRGRDCREIRTLLCIGEALGVRLSFLQLHTLPTQAPTAMFNILRRRELEDLLRSFCQIMDMKPNPVRRISRCGTFPLADGY